MSPQRHAQEQEQERRKESKDSKASKERRDRDDEPPRNVRPHGRGPQEPQPKGRTAQGEKRAPAAERMKGKPGGKKGGTTQG